MITRELAAADAEAVLELVATARSGCPFPRPAAAVLWRRWCASSTILGTFDDAGALYSVRVIDRLEARRARLRAACHRDPLDPTAGYSETMKRSLRGYVGWLRRVGIERIVVPLPPGLLERFEPVRPRLAGAIVGEGFECRTDDLAAFAEAP